MKNVIIFIQDEYERKNLKKEIEKNLNFSIIADAENFDDFQAVTEEYSFDIIIASYDCTGFPKFNEFISSLNNTKKIYLISSEKVDYFEKKSISINYCSDSNQILQEIE